MLGRLSRGQVASRVAVTAAALTIPLFAVVGGATSASADVRFDKPSDVLSSVATPVQADAADLRAPLTTRARLAKVNTSLFPADASQASTVRFNLFADTAYSGVVEKVEPGLDARTWSGRLTSTNGYFYAAESDGVMLLHVATPKGVYEVSQVKGSDTYRVVEYQKNEPEAKRDVRLTTVGKVDPQAATRDGADAASRIDVMVLYSNQARAAEGSIAALKARINLAVTETNGGYANAGVTTRMRLVHIEAASYNESGSFDTDLARLAGGSDPYITQVHTLRTQYGADMVQMIIENTDYCGLANAIMANANNAFAVTSRSCTTGYYSFGHEFGHLQGARHDTYVDPTNTPYSYGHGYTNPSAGWRTIMAYNNRCSDAGTNCTRLKYWSNPNVTYGGAPTGTSVTKNYQVLNNTAATVANFRQTTMATNFSSSMNGTAGSAGWTAVKGVWHIGSTYYASGGIPNTKASAFHPGTFGDVQMTARIRRVPAGGALPNALVFGGQASLTPTNQWRPSLVFQWTDSKLFSVYRINSDGTTTPIKGWTASNAIVPGGWNNITAISVAGSLRMKINGTTVWSGSTTAFRFGRVGFNFSRAAAASTLQVDSFSAATAPAAADAGPDVAGGPTIPGGSIDRAPR